jgi:hypothetical protein
MTASLTSIGIDDVSDRALMLLEAKRPADIPAEIVVGSRYFVSLMVCDASNTPPEEIAACARALLKAGCVYFCCWGPNCERVHDIVDEQYLIESGYSVNDDDSIIMTTWHNDESLEEAAWFAINVAFPDDRFFEECKAIVAVCVDNATWSEALKHAFSDPRALVARVVAEN